jgi:hypothetical protein
VGRSIEPAAAAAGRRRDRHAEGDGALGEQPQVGGGRQLRGRSRHAAAGEKRAAKIDRAQPNEHDAEKRQGQALHDAALEPLGHPHEHDRLDRPAGRDPLPREHQRHRHGDEHGGQAEEGDEQAAIDDSAT